MVSTEIFGGFLRYFADSKRELIEFFAAKELDMDTTKIKNEPQSGRWFYTVEK